MHLFFVTILLGLALGEDANQSAFYKPVQLVSSGQYHYISSGGFLPVMFSILNITSNQYAQASVSAALNISIFNPNSAQSMAFDFLSFPSGNMQAAAQYRCYQNSVALNISSIGNCSLPTCGSCDSSCIVSCFSSSNKDNTTCCCSGCSTSYNITLMNNTKFREISSSQIIMVLDNSDFLGPYNQPIPPMSLLVYYELTIGIDQQYQVFLYIVFGLFGLFLLIMVATCIWLYRKISSTGKDLLLYQRKAASVALKEQ